MNNIMMNDNCQEYDYSMKSLLLICNKPFHICSKNTHIKFLLRSCIYEGGLARVPGLARFAEISPSQKFHSITYNVLSSVYMRAGPARLGQIPPLLTRELD